MLTNPYILAAIALAIGFFLGRGITGYRSNSFQNRGEQFVREQLRIHFAAPDFHLLNHITLKLKDGTTQVDHILVSRYGVFVIETKDYSGWIFANSQHSTWTQVLYGGKFKFQNPIFQNFRHKQAVQDLLDFLPPNVIKPVVVFVGSAEFKTDIPSGVFTISGLIEHIRSFKEEVLSSNRVQFCVGRLETTRLAITDLTDLEHLESLEHRHSNRK